MFVLVLLARDGSCWLSHDVGVFGVLFGVEMDGGCSGGGAVGCGFWFAEYGIVFFLWFCAIDCYVILGWGDSGWRNVVAWVGWFIWIYY
jgi:hypothetical protein